jgi:hypothetical protein
VAQFVSAFRSRRSPVAGEIGAAIISCYKKRRIPTRIAKTYVDVMPTPPPLVERNREKRYREVRVQRNSMQTTRITCQPRRACRARCNDDRNGIR